MAVPPRVTGSIRHRAIILLAAYFSATGTNNANCWNGSNNTYTDPTNYLTPVGAFAASPGPYGTYDMGGDVWQWTEQAIVSGGQRRLYNGSWAADSNALASYDYLNYNPATPTNEFGFRVAASVPEPSTSAILLAGAIGLLACAWRRRASRSSIACLAVLALVSPASLARADVFNMGGTHPTTGVWTGEASLEFSHRHPLRVAHFPGRTPSATSFPVREPASPGVSRTTTVLTASHADSPRDLRYLGGLKMRRETNRERRRNVGRRRERRWGRRAGTHRSSPLGDPTSRKLGRFRYGGCGGLEK